MVDAYVQICDQMMSIFQLHDNDDSYFLRGKLEIPLVSFHMVVGWWVLSISRWILGLSTAVWVDIGSLRWSGDVAKNVSSRGYNGELWEEGVGQLFLNIGEYLFDIMIQDNSETESYSYIVQRSLVKGKAAEPTDGAD